ncbi:MAG: TonB-dependent receptor [Candidatus Sphingomonas phytovorans]|nr:TonB-dependent receptor [Sphingomonas sp.]WEJ98435.1 MAG: TonB-dependent receptor [Sphingomonas sp.]
MTKGKLCATTALWFGLWVPATEAQSVEPQATPVAVAPQTSISPVAESDERSADSGDRLADIVVTANRREEALQNVPAAITAISGETLIRDNISDLSGIANRTPGLSFAAFAAGQPEIAIRGVGTKEDGPAASDSTVVSVDGVYIAARSAQVFDLFDLERVEVLRGPQGTLYGKNSIGGSVNFVTLQPNSTPQFKARIKIGNYGRMDAAGLVSGPIADNLFGKIAVSYRSNDGYLRNVLVGSPFYGQRWGETESVSYRGTLRWEPTDRFSASVTIDGAHDDNGATNREPVGSQGPLHNCGCASDPVAVNVALGGAGSPYTTLADVEGYTRRNIFGVNVQLAYQFDFATLSSISSYRRTSYDYLEDSSGLPAARVFTDLTGASGNPNNVLLSPATNGFTFKITDAVNERPRQYTQELRLTSPSGESFDWIAGIFVTKEKNFRIEGFNFPSLGRADRLPSISNSYQSNDGFAYAGYAQASYRPIDRLKITAGGRYSYERKEITSEARIVSGLPLLLQAYPLVSARASWSNFSWKVIADYEIAPRLLTYASVATGFKSGGFTGTASTAAVATRPFGPENATNYELGVKSELFDRRLRLNVAAFYTDYRNLQVTRFFQPAGTTFGQFITENAGKASIKGIEVEAAASPVSGVEIGGTFAYLDARYTEFTGTPSTIVTGAFTNNRLRQAPEYTASAYAGYSYRLAGGEKIAVRANYKYQSLSYYDADNNPITVIPGYDLVDASLGVTSADGHFEVSVWAKNLTNTEYRTHVFSQRDSRVAFALFGDPRTYGLTLGFNF